jgi:hypothetical protein
MGRCSKQRRKGFALVVAMIFVCVFGTLLVCYSSMANLNAQISHNARKVNCALGSAQSGLDVMRLLFENITVSSAIEPGDRLNAVDVRLQENLAAAGMSYIIDDEKYNYDGSTITIQDVILDSQSNQIFSVEIQQIDDDTVQVDVIGCRDQITRTIRTNFEYVSSRSPVFDYGVASRGPLALSGNAKLRGLNFDAEANVYIESTDNDLALTMGGNSQIDGEVSIGNPDAYVDLSGNSEIAGESGQEAIDNHVYIGIDAPEFPLPDISPFGQYVQNLVDQDTITSGNLTFQNIRIIAGTNPSFSGNISFNGIIFIESPNIISFSGNIDITGLIVTDGDADFPYSMDSLGFTGNLHTYDCSYLPEGEDFDGLRNLTGSFLLAPGFSITFSGNFHTIGGVIAGNGITFSGNAGGTINGSVINYSQDVMSLSGNPTLYFSLPEIEESPAGFSEDKKLQFNPASYTEIVL